MTKKTYRVLSFDPGISNTGWSVSDYSPKTGTMSVYRFGEIKAAQRAKRVINRTECEMYGNQLVSLDILRSEVRELIATYQPEFIAIEDAFYNPRRPNAYFSLKAWHITIDLLCRDEFQLPTWKIPALSAKKAITGHGGGGKIPVQDAIYAADCITFKQRKLADTLSEHTADSVAIAYCFNIKILPGILSVMSVGASDVSATAAA